MLIYLIREKQFDAAMLEQTFGHRAVLLGISGLSSDMRQLHQASTTNGDARLAIGMFCASVRKQLAAMISVMNGADLIVLPAAPAKMTPRCAGSFAGG